MIRARHEVVVCGTEAFSLAIANSGASPLGESFYPNHKCYCTSNQDHGCVGYAALYGTVRTCKPKR